jgi:uncharacterized protein
VTTTALRLTILVDETDTWQGRPVYAEVVHRAHAAGLAGATALRGIEGYGATSRIHTARLLSLHEDLPVMVVVVDEPSRIREFLPGVREVLSGGLVTVEEVEVIG